MPTLSKNILLNFNFLFISEHDIGSETKFTTLEAPEYILLSHSDSWTT